MFVKKYNENERAELAIKIQELYSEGFLVAEVQEKLQLKNKFFYTICNEYNISSPNKRIQFEASEEMLNQIKNLFDERMSARQIALKLNITDKIFEGICGRNNIINPKLSKTAIIDDETINIIEKLFNEGYGPSSIANQINSKSRLVVQNILDQLNLSRNPSIARKNNKKSKKDKFDKLVCEMCKIEKPIEEFIRAHKKKDKENYSYCSSKCDSCYKNKQNASNKIYAPKRIITKSQRKKINKQKQQRIENDPSYKLRGRVSSSVRRILRLNSGSKNGSSILDKLSYTIEELRSHLESQWVGDNSWMNWDNYGIYKRGGERKWHIDHIIPQSLLPYDTMDHPNFLKSWALENLRPLEAIENIKKSDKIINIEEQVMHNQT